MAEIGNVTVRVNAVITDEQYHEAMSAVSAANEYIAALEAENAKLRELVRAAYRCTNAGPNCLECRIVAGGCTLLSAMRELGIEVPR